MAMTDQQRSAKAALKRAALSEEELRLRVPPNTRHALAELMEWAGITEQGEALTLMIHHVQDLGRKALCGLLARATKSKIAKTWRALQTARRSGSAPGREPWQHWMTW